MGYSKEATETLITYFIAFLVVDFLLTSVLSIVLGTTLPAFSCTILFIPLLVSLVLGED